MHAVGGKPGVGKTTFTSHAARRLLPRFPGSQLFIDLHGHMRDHPPLSSFDAPVELLNAISVPAKLVPATLDGRSAPWRQGNAGQRALLVFDTATDADEVKSLLPGSPQSLILVTSRHRLVDLDAITIELDVLSPEVAGGVQHRLISSAG